jgi:hypothetical protein
MSTEQQKAFCVLRFSKCESVITTQNDLRRRYGFDAPISQSIPRIHIYTYTYCKQFVETGCLGNGKSTPRAIVVTSCIHVTLGINYKRYAIRSME